MATQQKRESAAHKADAADRRPHKGLTATQEELADLASRMLLDGGAREDIELLLTALARHQYRNLSFVRGRCASEIDKLTKEGAAMSTAHWYRDLRSRWFKATESKEPALTHESAPVTELVRANLRNSVRERFEAFLTDVNGIEPVWVLNEILSDVNAGEDLGQAVHYALGGADIYIRVPLEHKKRVQEFVAILGEEECRS